MSRDGNLRVEPYTIAVAHEIAGRSEFAASSHSLARTAAGQPHRRPAPSQGAAVSNRLGAMFPNSVVGMYGPGIRRSPDDGAPLAARERTFTERRDRQTAENGGAIGLQRPRYSPTTCPARHAPGQNAPATSSTGPRCPAVPTSQPLRSQNSSPTTSASSPAH